MFFINIITFDKKNWHSILIHENNIFMLMREETAQYNWQHNSEFLVLNFWHTTPVSTTGCPSWPGYNILQDYSSEKSKLKISKK